MTFGSNFSNVKILKVSLTHISIYTVYSVYSIVWAVVHSKKADTLSLREFVKHIL